ncbi:hypothetical protein PEX1_062780 [Penicillium expansum]|uniref:Uncharacterized protein n=1 Tax=Penicillium expansum TaxID=27334 RepID=A0A0A2JMN5_PENEN|nr:hypothetical protein PEX2_087830 [Penicillium expansum]KGO35925.1 hypothetical protein PEXP_037130 [Penicillium expansum]KGO55918.1 hypothetical protein PEX1_062780 [Penicillium expansum]KGO60601.1 hypothetical protein PEX2_087830 [Penicillium expansum]
MEPPRPPLPDNSSPVRMAAINDESIVPHVFVAGRLVSRNRATQENSTIILSSTESDNNLHGRWTPPLLASTSQFAAPVDSQYLTASQAEESDIPYDEWFEYQPLDEVDTEFVGQTSNAVETHEPASQAEERRARWALIETHINYEDSAIAQIMSFMSPFDIYPGEDFYVRYVKVAWMCGLDAMIEAKSRLNNKLRNHERYLEEVNEVIALDPQLSPGDACYNLRVYNINERARMLGALDQYDTFMRYAEAIGMNNPNDPEGFAAQQAHGNPNYIHMQPGRAIDDGSHGNLSTDGTNEVARANINRGVDIINPETGHPIQFQRQLLTATNNNRNGTGRTDGSNSDSDNMQVDGSSELMIRDGVDGNRNRNRRNSRFNQIQVDRRSELDVNGTSGNVPMGSNDPLFDANSRLDSLFIPEMGSEAEISWTPQEAWTERRPRNDIRVSRTLPRNFGRNIHNFRAALHSITELDHEEHAIELTSTDESDGSHTPNLVLSDNEDEVNHSAFQNRMQYLQNEPRVTSVSSSLDDEQQTMRNSSPGPGLNEEMLSELSFDREHRSTEELDYQASIIPSDFFDVFVVDVEGDQEWGGSGGRRGRFLDEQFEDGMNHSFGGDYPDDMSDTPLLSQNSPFGRHNPLSRNSPSRAISRSSVRHRHYVPVGGLSSVGSRMITSSLNARRRHDARENVRNARRALTNSSRLIDDLRDKVPVTTVLGLDTPDSRHNFHYLPVYSTQLIDASVRHTAPAIVNTSRINAHARI